MDAAAPSSMPESGTVQPVLTLAESWCTCTVRLLSPTPPPPGQDVRVEVVDPCQAHRHPPPGVHGWVRVAHAGSAVATAVERAYRAASARAGAGGGVDG